MKLRIIRNPISNDTKYCNELWGSTRLPLRGVEWRAAMRLPPVMDGFAEGVGRFASAGSTVGQGRP